MSDVSFEEAMFALYSEFFDSSYWPDYNERKKRGELIVKLAKEAFERGLNKIIDFISLSEQIYVGGEGEERVRKIFTRLEDYMRQKKAYGF